MPNGSASSEKPNANRRTDPCVGRTVEQGLSRPLDSQPAPSKGPEPGSLATHLSATLALDGNARPRQPKSPSSLLAKTIGIFIVAALGGAVVYWIVTTREEQQAKEARSLRVRKDVADLAARYNALTDWERQLSKGERSRSSPILRFELERLWRDRPILFVGSIKDITSADADSYEILLEKSVYYTDAEFTTELRLSLRAPKSTIDPLLQEHPEVLEIDRIESGIAVIARIAKVGATDELSTDGKRIETRTGYGELLGLAPTGGVFAGSSRKTVSRDDTDDE